VNLAIDILSPRFVLSFKILFFLNGQDPIHGRLNRDVGSRGLSMPATSTNDEMNDQQKHECGQVSGSVEETLFVAASF
jgi:hypothetical protein